MNYDEAKRLMNNSYFKGSNKKFCNDVMEKKGLEFNQWVRHGINNLFGLKDDDFRWCWRNSINTHPYCFCDLYNFSVQLGMEEMDFSNSGLWLSNLKKLWLFIEDKWELFFTNNIETKYYNQLLLRTNKSWSIGQITTIAFLFVYREIFKNYNFKSLSYSFDRGDLDDFNGIDVRILTTTNEEFTIQIKNGIFQKTKDSFLINSSVNDLRSPATHYCFVEIQNNETKIVVLKNIVENIIREGEVYKFPLELLENSEIIKNMPIPQKLHEILMFCANNKIVFDLKNKPEEPNNVTWEINPEKIVIVTIGDFKDEKLNDYLSNKFTELKEAFK